MIFFPQGWLCLGFLAGSLFLHVCYLIPWQPQQLCLHKQIPRQREEGSAGKTRVLTSRGNPKTGTVGVLIGSLQASVLTPWVCRVVHRWQPGVAASWHFEAVGEGKRHPRAHALQPASPGGEAGSCPCVANHSSPPCWSLRAAVTVGEAFKKPRYLPPLPHAAAGFREKTLWSTAPLHNAF